MYYSDKVTDEKLKKLEKRIAKMYQGAYAEMAETWDKYINGYDEDGAIKNVHHKSLKERYEQEYQAFLDGAYTEAEFKAWYRTQIERGEGYAKMRDQLANRMTNANMVASAYINDATPSVYTLNRDYEAYRINNAYGVDFHLGDEMTERRLIGNDNHIEFKTTSVNPTRDYNWNREQIHKALTAGIMQGKSIDKLTDAYMQVMKRNRSSAIRNARTSFTSAQNAGRIETYYRATEMGISLTKEWIANHDAHTRDSHAHLDGERVAYDMPFSNGLRYPADPEGIPAEVYNCRCTMRAVIPKINDGRLNYKEANTSKPFINVNSRNIETNSDIIKLAINQFQTTDELYMEAFSIEEEYGYENICTHGDRQSMQAIINGVAKNLNAKEYARHLRDNLKWSGKDLKLCACETGRGENSFAQQLSKELGIKVKAPDDDVYYIPEDGTVFVGSPHSNMGTWRVFVNGVEEK